MKLVASFEQRQDFSFHPLKAARMRRLAFKGNRIMEVIKYFTYDEISKEAALNVRH